MSNDDMNIPISSIMKHMIQLCCTFVIVGSMYGVLVTRVDALQENKRDVQTELRTLQNDVNKQAVIIGGIVVTTKNIEKQMDNSHRSIEKQMEIQQRLLERISEQLTRPNN